MIKNIIIPIILFMLALPAYSDIYKMGLPLEGSSIATDSLQFYTRKDIYSLIHKKFPYCTQYSVKNTQLIQYPYETLIKDGKYLKGYWKELWSVNVCGKIIQIPITFYTEKSNADYYFDKDLILRE